MELQTFVAILPVLLICSSSSTAASPSSSKKMTKELSFPFFENEVQFPNSTFPIEFENLKGELKISNTVVKGLDNLIIKAELDRKTGLSSSSINSAGELGVSGIYELSLKGKTPNGFEFVVSGFGEQQNSVHNLSISHEAMLKDGENGFLTISDLNLTVSFDLISLNLENFEINGFNINWVWEPLNKFLNGSFQELFPQVRNPLSKILMKRLNEKMKEQKISFKQLIKSLKESFS